MQRMFIGSFMAYAQGDIFGNWIYLIDSLVGNVIVQGTDCFLQQHWPSEYSVAQHMWSLDQYGLRFATFSRDLRHLVSITKSGQNPGGSSPWWKRPLLEHYIMNSLPGVWAQLEIRRGVGKRGNKSLGKKPNYLNWTLCQQHWRCLALSLSEEAWIF